MFVSLDISLSESGTRCHIIDMFLDVTRNVIGLGRDILSSGGVFPDEELSNE